MKKESQKGNNLPTETQELKDIPDKDESQPLPSKPKTVSIWTMYNHLCTRRELVLVAIATIASLLSGISLPVSVLLYGDLTSKLGDSYTNDPDSLPYIEREAFYKDFDEIKDKIFDGMIVTGAALDQTEFKDVTYWLNLKKILLWSTKNVTSTLFSCWGVAAALKAFYDIDIIFRQDKLSGIYDVELSSKIDTLTRGFDDVFKAPISRYCDFPLDIINEKTDINVLASSKDVGLYLGVSGNGKQVYVSGHPEYDVDTLDQEYHRDLAANKSPNIPINYYPDNDPNKAPLCSWRGHSSLLFCNWLNYYVYQETPYDPYQSK